MRKRERPHWSGNRQRCVWVSVSKHLRSGLVRYCSVIQRTSRAPAEKPAPCPLQTSWRSDRAVPVCSGLTHGTGNPTSLSPLPCPELKPLLPWLSRYSIQHQPPFSALRTFLELHFKNKNNQHKGSWGQEQVIIFLCIAGFVGSFWRTWITVETPTLYAWDNPDYQQTPPPGQKTRTTVVWWKRKACEGAVILYIGLEAFSPL